ncbi:hypothetical protein GGI25_000772 [Coemansia spiralis]|uniref:Uncharacterized protein n=1 Tax=Coemansia spiralis TaxID=417178 RepID=A0A9W8GCA8_9FUNG|nr:hypothetical protein GGI25_000772 [Coemansia spiralis]
MALEARLLGVTKKLKIEQAKASHLEKDITRLESQMLRSKSSTFATMRCTLHQLEVCFDDIIGLASSAANAANETPKGDFTESNASADRPINAIEAELPQENEPKAPPQVDLKTNNPDDGETADDDISLHPDGYASREVNTDNDQWAPWLAGDEDLKYECAMPKSVSGITNKASISLVDKAISWKENSGVEGSDHVEEGTRTTMFGASVNNNADDTDSGDGIDLVENKAGSSSGLKSREQKSTEHADSNKLIDNGASVGAGSASDGNDESKSNDDNPRATGVFVGRDKRMVLLDGLPELYKKYHQIRL